MISVGTKLYISDNSGAVQASCIKVLGTSPRRKGKPGDIIVVAIQKVKNATKVDTHQVKKALILGTVYPIQKSTGITIRFKKNTAILIDDKHMPIANRITQYVLSNFRLKNYMKIVSLSFGML
jgi:large subunit ribosomal protein L14